MENRKQQIVKRIEEARETSLAKLSEEFGVSELTIRRDLKSIEESRKIKIGKGEVVWITEDPLNGNIEIDPREEVVAEMAASGIDSKDRIIWIGGGNISMGIARRIENVTLVTNSLKSASAALKRTGVKVFLLGAEVDPNTYCLFGKSLEKIKEFAFNKAFIEVDGYFNKQFRFSSEMAETVSYLGENVVEKILVIRGDNFGNVNTEKVKGLKEFKVVYTDTAKSATMKEIEGMSIQVVSKNIEPEKRNEKIIPLKEKMSR